VKVMMRGHKPFRVTYLRQKNSNSCNSKNTYSLDTIKVTLEREYKTKHELIKNTGGKVVIVMIRDYIPSCITCTSPSKKFKWP
jgi:hypothetical protein